MPAQFAHAKALFFGSSNRADRENRPVFSTIDRGGLRSYSGERICPFVRLSVRLASVSISHLKPIVDTRNPRANLQVFENIDLSQI
jgi:hypothetical protein